MPLLHLTTKFHIVLLTYQFLTKIHNVGCCIMSFNQVAINQLTELTTETHPDLSSMVAIFVAFFKEHPKIPANHMAANLTPTPSCWGLILSVHVLCLATRTTLRTWERICHLKTSEELVEASSPSRVSEPSSFAFKMIPVKPAQFKYPTASMFQICCYHWSAHSMGARHQGSKRHLLD